MICTIKVPMQRMCIIHNSMQSVSWSTSGFGGVMRTHTHTHISNDLWQAAKCKVDKSPLTRLLARTCHTCTVFAVATTSLIPEDHRVQSLLSAWQRNPFPFLQITCTIQHILNLRYKRVPSSASKAALLSVLL